MRNLTRREFAFGASLLGASLFALSGCAGVGQDADNRPPVAARGALESDFITALEHLYLAAPGARQLIAVSTGVLVFPTIVATAPLPTGEIGQGALRVANAFTDYFRLIAQAVPPSRSPSVSGVKSIIFAFTSFDALNALRNQPSWPAERAQLLSPSRLATLAGQSRPKYPPVAALVLEGERGERLAAGFSLHGLTAMPLAS